MIEDHVIAAQEALRFNSQLNDWERDFLECRWSTQTGRRQSN